MPNFIHGALDEALGALRYFMEDKIQLARLEDAIGAMVAAYRSGRKVISCGNGGSLCDAMHFSEELTGRFRRERSPLAAMALGDPAHLTCVANDYGYRYVFARAIEAIGVGGDVLLAISTSGNSENILEAITTAKRNKIKTIGLLGKGGGEAAGMVDYSLVVGGNTSDRIQEMHIKLIHIFVEGIERGLFPENYTQY